MFKPLQTVHSIGGRTSNPLNSTGSINPVICKENATLHNTQHTLNNNCITCKLFILYTFYSGTTCTLYLLHALNINKINKLIFMYVLFMYVNICSLYTPWYFAYTISYMFIWVFFLQIFKLQTSI